MKKLKMNPVKLILSGMLLLIFSACSKKITFLTSPVVPAARGNVSVKKDNNNNYKIQVDLDGLAEVSRLQPPKKMYIVWMTSDVNTTKNIGQIKSSTGFMSKNLKASFATVAATKPNKIFITAEDDESVQYPAGEVVLTTDNF